jgi:hypothetical protein
MLNQYTQPKYNLMLSAVAMLNAALPEDDHLYNMANVYGHEFTGAHATKICGGNITQTIKRFNPDERMPVPGDMLVGWQMDTDGWTALQILSAEIIDTKTIHIDFCSKTEPVWLDGHALGRRELEKFVRGLGFSTVGKFCEFTYGQVGLREFNGAWLNWRA